MDPRIRSPWTWLIEGKIVGLDELAERAKKTGKFDYGAKVAGLVEDDGSHQYSVLSSQFSVSGAR